TVIVCGVFKVVPLAFSAEPCAGRFLYILMYTLLGYFLDPTVLDVVAAVHLPVGVLGSLVPLILLLAWIARAPRPRSGPHYRGQCGGSAPLLARRRGCRRAGHIGLHADHERARARRGRPGATGGWRSPLAQ